MHPVIAVHGGAGAMGKKQLSNPRRQKYDEALHSAAATGLSLMKKGGSAINAVKAAVTKLEDFEYFNAGRGAALCADGTVELSASIMRGRDRAAGAMVGLKRTKNPILAARSIMTSHSHVLLFGEEADNFGEAKGLDMVSHDYFLTNMRRRQWERYKDKHKIALDHDAHDDGQHGTVGAVAMDRRGNLAAATSTGGLVNQLPGRVGDTPVIGAGTWADNKTCAVSASGKGDAFARIAFARRVADLVELSSLPIEEAGRRALAEVSNLGATGGCIAIDAKGRIAMPFSSKHMMRGWSGKNGEIYVAVHPEEAVCLNQ